MAEDKKNLRDDTLDQSPAYSAFGVSAPTGWRSSLKSRLAQRTVTRGLLGAGFYTWGAIRAENDIKFYDYEKPRNTIQRFARFLDNTVGKTDRAIFNSNWKEAIYDPSKVKKGFRAEDGMRLYRESRRFKINETDKFGNTRQRYRVGRTWGPEIISVTFEFAMGSVGDSLGRQLIEGVEEKIWQNKQGKFDLGKLVDKSMHSLWRVFSYHQMEDWAVAVPYVALMKWQRHAIEKLIPGADRVLANQQNGGTKRITPDTQITGTYMMAGALDLQSRFTWYNVFTSIFRDGYNSAKDSIDTWRKRDYALPNLSVPNPESAIKNTASGVGDVLRYLARQTIKGFIIMTPSVPFFWFTRTPQTQTVGLAADPTYGPLVTSPLGGDWWRTDKPLKENDPLFMVEMDSKMGQVNKVRSVFYDSIFHEKGYSPWDKKHYKMDTLLGKASHGWSKLAGEWISQKPGRFLGAVGKQNADGTWSGGGLLQGGAPILGINTQTASNRRRVSSFSNRYANAAVSYTPYFIAKNEFDYVWDTPQMNEAIDYTLNNLLSPQKVDRGFRAIEKAIVYPREEELREKQQNVFTEKEEEETALLESATPRFISAIPEFASNLISPKGAQVDASYGADKKLEKASDGVTVH
jgi:hypothetical protein